MPGDNGMRVESSTENYWSRVFHTRSINVRHY